MGKTEKNTCFFFINPLPKKSPRFADFFVLERSMPWLSSMSSLDELEVGGCGPGCLT